MAPEVKDSRPPAIRCKSCGRICFLNLKGKLVHWDTESYRCPEILPSGLKKPAA